MRIIESFRNLTNPSLPTAEELIKHRRNGGSVVLRFGKEPPINITAKIDERLFQEIEAGESLDNTALKITQETRSLFETMYGKDLTITFLDAERRIVRTYKGRPRKTI